MSSIEESQVTQTSIPQVTDTIILRIIGTSWQYGCMGTMFYYRYPIAHLQIVY